VKSNPNAVLLFPLQRAVFFPFTNKPLNVFEPKFIKLINDALETGAPVALAYAEDGRRRTSRELGQVRRVAGVGVIHLLERRADGTMLILLKGTGKVRLERAIQSDEPYLSVEAKWVEENNLIEQPSLFLLNRMMKEFSKWLESTVPDPDQRDAFLELVTTPEEKINYMCSLMVMDPELQQALLETDDLNERLKALALILDEEVLHH
jgi:ATP-dependent Lon protease